MTETIYGDKATNCAIANAVLAGDCGAARRKADELARFTNAARAVNG